MEKAGQTVVFVSWSGERSRELAIAMRDFLGNVIQSVQPLMSEKDIQAGKVWDAELTEMIRAAKFGIACVTAENRDSPWLHFEAGALSNAVGEEKRLCPYLLGVRKSDLRQPLARFQAKEPNETDTFALIESINTLCAVPLQREKLKVAFGKFWHDFEKAVGGIAKGSPHATTARDSDEKIDEILSIARDLARLSAQENASFSKYLQSGPTASLRPAWQLDPALLGSVPDYSTPYASEAVRQLGILLGKKPGAKPEK